MRAPQIARTFTENIRSEEVLLGVTILKTMVSMLTVVHCLACGWWLQRLPLPELVLDWVVAQQLC